MQVGGDKERVAMPDPKSIRRLSPELATKAQKELGEVPDRIEEDIETLRTWISKQPHLTARQDSQFLVAFLRGCKYSLEKTKLKLDNFYAMRGAVPELYKNRFVGEKQLGILETGCLLRLPQPLQPDGPRIHISRYGLYDSKKYSIAEVVQVSTMMGEIQIREDDNAMISGFVEIIDMKGVGAGHIFQFDAVLVKKLAVLGDKALPYRPKGFHFVNAPASAETMMSIAKSLMSEKIRKRFHIHSKLESLYKYVPKECLPAEYGGSNGTIQDVVTTWREKLFSYQKFFEEEVSYGTNEKLRRGEAINAESLFGIDGSFRKLDID
ncbi:alpha-tocopherol transfer protein-like isoform X2 [Drosophila subobscura]|uniref:alpha-tocopherol transfer protein-like isoform X2 n=1 Tax=Drosophila subobscura TaxID=7241 RepID=UPI00155A282D|nr:alpha-tocopherol transfer protein-like isoform X2 [Drosophila subobscura]